MFVSGFVAPDGRYIFCPILQHDTFAQEEFGMSKDDLLEKHGYCEVSYSYFFGQHTIVCGCNNHLHQLTDEQRNTLLSFDVDDWDPISKYDLGLVDSISVYD